MCFSVHCGKYCGLMLFFFFLLKWVCFFSFKFYLNMWIEVYSTGVRSMGLSLHDCFYSNKSCLVHQLVELLLHRWHPPPPTPPPNFLISRCHSLYPIKKLEVSFPLTEQQLEMNEVQHAILSHWTNAKSALLCFFSLFPLANIRHQTI